MYKASITILSLLSLINFSGYAQTFAPVTDGQSNTFSLVGQDPTLTSICSSDGSVAIDLMEVLSQPFSGGTAFFYLTNANSTLITTITLPAEPLGAYTYRTQFSSLTAGTYTLQLVVADSSNTCIFISDCIPVSVMPADDTCCPITITATDSGLLSPVFMSFVSLAAYPSSMKAHTPYKLHYDWTNPCIAGLGAVIKAFQPATYTVQARGVNAIDCTTPLCCTSGSISVNSVGSGSNSVCLSAPFTYSLTKASSPCACDGSITLMLESDEEVIFFLTDLNSTTTIEVPAPASSTVGASATFSNLTPGTYYAYYLTTTSTSIGDCLVVQLTANSESSCSLSVCSQSSTCGNVVTLVALPTGTPTKCTNLSFVWESTDSQGNNPCIIGSGPTVQVATTGYYRVIGRCAANGIDCSIPCCISSDPILVTISNAAIDCSAPTVTIDSVCLCAGQPLSLTVRGTTTSQTACCTINGYPQVIVTGPGCFSFSGPITLDNTPIAIPVTDFATIANAGCYFATVVDASGCIGTNITQPGKVVVTTCPCP